MNSFLLPHGCDLAILTSPASLYYVSGIDGGDATIVVSTDATYYVTSPLYEVETKSALRKGLILRVFPAREQDAFIRSLIADGMTIGLEESYITLSRSNALLVDKSVQTIDVSDVLVERRMIKTSDELAVIRRAEGIVDAAYAAVNPMIREGVTEREIANMLLFEMLTRGADGTAFDTIVAFGDNAAKPHAVPSDRSLHKGDCIVMDFGAKVGGYCSDFTRTRFFGKPTERFDRAYQLVLQAQKAALDYIEAGGRDCAIADRISREIIDGSEFRGAFNHTLGHGVGIEIHERPYLRKDGIDKLKDGVVFTVEPGIYVEGEFGIRIESLAMIENGKLTVIDRSDKENYII